MKCSYFMPSLALFALLLAGCGKPADRVEISESTPASQYLSPPKLDATSEERFKQPEMPGAQATAPDAQAMAQAPEASLHFHLETPPGWTELEPIAMRASNFSVGPNGEAECYLSVLPGGGGGIRANADRWRGQMQLAPYTDEEFAALTRIPVFEQQALYIQFDGAYKDMGAAEPIPGYRLMGLLFEYESHGVYLKFVGPADVATAEQNRFIQLIGSLQPADHAAHDTAAVEPTVAPAEALPANHPPLDTAQAAPSASPAAGATEGKGGGYAWSIPAGWEATPERPMRLITYRVAEGVECYVTVLGGTAGGAAMNINRWRGQMGAAQLSDAEIAQLPTITVLGKPAPMVEVSGTYTDMQGAKTEGQMLLGTAAISETGSVFIRMTGPEGEVAGLKDAFTQFCASFRAE